MDSSVYVKKTIDLKQIQFSNYNYVLVKIGYYLNGRGWNLIEVFNYLQTQVSAFVQPALSDFLIDTDYKVILFQICKC